MRNDKLEGVEKNYTNDKLEGVEKNYTNDKLEGMGKNYTNDKLDGMGKNYTNDKLDGMDNARGFVCKSHAKIYRQITCVIHISRICKIYCETFLWGTVPGILL